MKDITSSVVELYRKAATSLPDDIVRGLSNAASEEDNETSANVLKDILENIKLAKDEGKPMCQDTGTPIFFVKYSCKFSQIELRRAIVEATKIATAEIPLRPNAVDPISGKNTSGNEPVIYFEEWDKDSLQIYLMLKGGGSENIGREYKLPDDSLGAGRDVEGVKKCVVDAMFKAQGKGCSPNIIGVGIGGTKEQAILLAKKQLLRRLDDKNIDTELGKLEDELLVDVNKLGIGALGLGGKVSALGVKVGKMNRHPASFFVAVSFMCWASRKSRLEINGDEIKNH